MTAKIGVVNEPQYGLYLTVRVSNDFKYWWAANQVFLPRDNFLLEEHVITPELNRTLSLAYAEAVSTLTAGHAGTAAFKTQAEALVGMFTGVGAVKMTIELAEVALGSAIGCADSSSSCLNGTKLPFGVSAFIDAYSSLAQLYQPVKTVHTTACLRDPGFKYIVGCVRTGFPDKADSRACSSPPCSGDKVLTPYYFCCWLVTAYYLRLTTYCSLSTTYCSLLTAEYSLLTAHYLLLTAYC